MSSLIDLPTLEQIQQLHSTYTKKADNSKLELIHKALNLLYKVFVLSFNETDSASSSPTTEIPKSILDEKNTIQFTLEEFNKERQDGNKLDNLTIYRFLHGYDWSVEEGMRILIKTLNWRKNYQPEKIQLSEFKDTLIPEKFLIETGNAKDGTAIMYLWVSRDVLENTEENKQLKFRYLVYLHEQIIPKRFEKDAFQITWVVDVSGISLSLVKTMKGLFDEIGFYYSERLKRVCVLNAGWTINLIWGFLAPFFNEEVRNKYIIMKSKDELLNHIDKEQLIEEHGGDRKLDYDQYFKSLEESK
ncbi:hypothetical protein ABK040_008830 [Willaertia magna]